MEGVLREYRNTQEKERIAAATLLFAQGVDQCVVMEILGHSQISMTSRYAHVLPPVMTDGTEWVGRALGARRAPNCNPISRRAQRGTV